MAKIIDGLAYAASLRSRIKEETEHLHKKHEVTFGLSVVLVGEDPASQVYVRSKVRQTKEVGMRSFQHVLPATITEEDLLAHVHRLNNDTRVDGILVQLPLPAHIDEAKVLEAIAPEKDVDGFHASNVGALWSGLDGVAPCTPLGCVLLLKHYVKRLSGQHAVIVGRSNIVGKPIAALLLKEHCTVTIAHSRTRALDSLCQEADILVAAVGIPHMIKGDWVKKGASVIDVGINRIKKDDGKTTLVGDVDFEQASARASFITPVPGGVGPMTIACLLLNTLNAGKKRQAIT
ncbi:MAG: bifunctional methylenetetrahydrofolate dehydrogenase/methenyltetrahydrofolate cyclohydrolase FolD [Alphaproteobacteria bacterium GM7ARS4]|nr:bifunctional methylenetetrahydrofolate dehydrogenase/methenyltetrahydrofolate cyclohydrolase FolD [Alphaproteobacteria bacterium GM7ARS4]